MNRKVWLTVSIAMILTMVFASGCGFMDTTGESRPNIKPKVFIANVPLSSQNLADTSLDTAGNIVIDTLFDSVVATATYFANPQIYWYGTDEDGRVDAYEYSVIPTDSLDPHPVGLQVVRDSGTVNPRRFATNDSLQKLLDWVYVEAPNATVGLYADIDTTVAIDQFLFVRAIDNLGLRSDIRYARYSRKNHPPDSYIQLDTVETIRLKGSPNVVRGRKYYSLPQSTETYPGITIGWSGSDSLDYPEEQPAFDYNWALYGPYDTKEEAAIPDSSRMVRTNDNPNTLKLEWTTSDRHTFFNLRTGWYLFSVRSRDDAFVADPTPALGRFEVVEPSFDKPYLLMDASNYWEGFQTNSAAINFKTRAPGSLPALTPDSIHNFYYELFANQGWAFTRLDVWKRTAHFDSPNSLPEQTLLPDRDVLGRYKAVIVVEFDEHSPLDKDVTGGPQFEPALSDYLNVGGRVVLIGRNLFGPDVTNWSSLSPPQEVTFSAIDFPFKYFGVTRMYFPGQFSTTYDSNPNWVLITDFVGALPIDPNFPRIDADTSTPYMIWDAGAITPQDTIVVHGRSNVLTRIGIEGSPFWQLPPDVNWIGIDRTRGAVGFYQYDSRDPNTSPSQGRICGARFEYFDPILGQPTYRTAVLTFELWTMEHGDNLRRLAHELLSYILE